MFNKYIINKTNLIKNVKQVKKNNPSSKICAMVKADAYGVGICEVVKIIEEYVDYFGVACFFEAEQVSKFTNKNILIVGPLDSDNLNENYSYTINSLEEIQQLVKLNKKIKIHIKINSGMNRYGFSVLKELKKAIKLIKTSKLVLEGVYTHFATTDNYIKTQYEKFIKFAEPLKKEFPDIILHCDNSEVNEIANHNLDMVRIGFDLYYNNCNKFNSVVTIKSTIVQINNVKKKDLVGYNYRFVAKRNMKVAIIPIGYADGFVMEYLGMHLLLNNKLCQVINICMDCFMLDVSKTKLKKGDCINLLDEFNSVIKFAQHSKTSEYQVMTNFSKIRADKIITD